MEAEASKLILKRHTAAMLNWNLHLEQAVLKTPEVHGIGQEELILMRLSYWIQQKKQFWQ